MDSLQRATPLSVRCQTVTYLEKVTKKHQIQALLECPCTFTFKFSAPWSPSPHIQSAASLQQPMIKSVSSQAKEKKSPQKAMLMEAELMKP